MSLIFIVALSSILFFIAHISMLCEISFMWLLESGGHQCVHSSANLQGFTDGPWWYADWVGSTNLNTKTDTSTGN